tara:strand:+ start:4223 stop:4561 length:339 start_codon:yes stop_codon:yes gene_type:complete
MTADYDMRFGNQQADFLRDSSAVVAQIVLTRLRLWVNEWFLDVTTGTPYMEAVLGTGKRETIEPAMRARILDTDGVLEIDSFGLVIDPDTRIASVSAVVSTVYGEATLAGAI